MIVSRYLSEPEAHDPVSTPHAGSESFTRLSKVWRVIRRGRVFEFPFPRPRQPFDRLQFWTVRNHSLSFKLRDYDVTVPRPNMWRGYSWNTLRYWEQLLADPEASKPEYAGSLTAYTSDLFMADDIEYLNEINAAHLERLVRAEPFSD